MTTVEAQAVAAASQNIPWDKFLPENPVDRAQVIAWREREWPAIQQEFRQVHGIEIPNELEPHWAEPGAAVYYRFERTKGQVQETLPNGRTVFKWVDNERQWVTTNPLPANNPSQILNFMKDGTMLRPDETLSKESMKAIGVEEAAAPLSKPEPDRYFYFIKPDGTWIQSETWDQYIKTLKHGGGAPVDLEGNQPPQHIARKVLKFGYYCLQCDYGTDKRRAANMHVQSETRRKGRRYPHVTVKQMEVKMVKASDEEETREEESSNADDS